MLKYNNTVQGCKTNYWKKIDTMVTYILMTGGCAYCGKGKEKRGTTATDEISVLPQYEGTMVHDFWNSYYKYSCAHSLCNVHNIRELTGISELTAKMAPGHD